MQFSGDNPSWSSSGLAQGEGVLHPTDNSSRRPSEDEPDHEAAVHKALAHNQKMESGTPPNVWDYNEILNVLGKVCLAARASG